MLVGPDLMGGSLDGVIQHNTNWFKLELHTIVTFNLNLVNNLIRQLIPQPPIARLVAGLMIS